MSDHFSRGIGHKCAVVTGASGQDGQYLAEGLRDDGWSVIALSRTETTIDGNREALVDLRSADAVSELIRAHRPQEIYHLAAHHRSSEAVAGDIASTLDNSFQVHVHGLVNFLEAARKHSPSSRLFFAASSHIFGMPNESPQTEETPVKPICAYGITKAAGREICGLFRRQHGVFASVGILYNHESPRRPPSFLIPRLIAQANRVLAGETDEVVVGKLDAVTDWGYAPEYTDAMRRIIALPEAGDFIIASGVTRPVRDVVDCVFRELGLPANTPVREDPGLIAASIDRKGLVGNAAKLHAATNWRPRVRMEEIVARMVAATNSEPSHA